MATTKEILILARDKIVEGWAQGYYAYTAEGMRCNSANENACSWCALGALSIAMNKLVGPPDIDQSNWGLYGRVRDLLDSKTNDNLAEWNDQPGRTKEEVVN